MVGRIKAKMLLVNGRFDPFFDFTDLEKLKSKRPRPWI